MKKVYNLLFFIFFLNHHLFSQDLGGERVSIGNFIRRMYNAQPFNGVKMLQTQDGIDYMVSVVELKKDPNKPENIQSRIASVKAKAYASQYINGSNVSMDVVVITKEERTKDSIITKTTIQEVLKENSNGFVEGMEFLTRFNTNDEKQSIYIYYRELKKK